MFRRVTASNFLSWQELDFSFEPGVTLIEGFNHDDETSEGSGKSAILNALCWCLYGRIPKDAKVDDVVRNGSKSCTVTVFLEDGTQIVRERKPNDLYIVKEEDGSTYGKIKGKDAKETQAMIESLIGMSFETFCQAVYFAQNYPNKFVTATEEEKAKILSEILDLKIFDRARASAHQKIRDAELESNATEKDLAGIDLQILSVDRQLSDYGVLRDKAIREREARISEWTKSLEEYAAQVSELEAQIAEGPSPEAAQAERNKLHQLIAECEELGGQVNAALMAENRREYVERRAETLEATLRDLLAAHSAEDFDALNAEAKAIEEDIQDTEARKADLNSRLKGITQQRKLKDDIFKLQVRKLNDVKNLEADLERLKHPQDEVCPTCGTALGTADPEHLGMQIIQVEHALRAARAELDGITKEYEAVEVMSDAELKFQLAVCGESILIEKGRLGDIKAQLSEVTKAEQTIAAKQAELDACSQELATLPGESKATLEEQLREVRETVKQAKERDVEIIRFLDGLSGREQELQGLRALVAKLERDIAKELNDGTQELDERLASLQTNRAELESKKATTAEKVQAIRARMARLQTLKDGFREIKAYVFQNILGELTRKSNQYLVELFEVPVSIKFSNLSEDGEIAKIKVDVTYDGVERPLGLYSGGQFRRIQLAVDLALSEIISNRGSQSIQLRILDEYFKDLSESSMDKALHLLERLPGSTILIEHNSLFKSIVNNVFQVELEDGVSRRAA